MNLEIFREWLSIVGPPTVVVGTICFFSGIYLDNRFIKEDKIIVDVRSTSKSPIEFPALIIQIPSDNGTYIYGLILAGGPQWNALVKGNHLPPRCREVPKGFGCIDWAGPGEKLDYVDGTIVVKHNFKWDGFITPYEDLTPEYFNKPKPWVQDITPSPSLDKKEK